MIGRWCSPPSTICFSARKSATTARQAGVELTFARSPQEILQAVRESRPALVIFDLNSGKTDPIDTISAIKADPALSSIRTIGFASHVHTSLIAAAREAGADQVLPRSAFAGNLAEILLSSQNQSS